MKIPAACALIGTALALAAPQSRAAEALSTASAVVVELFTSQGCSSCPPADALLGELASRPNVVALSFHVDYWDSIGWRDRFSVPEANRRQSRYVETLGLSSGFTPQVVIDGRSSFVGSDRRRILAALADRAEFTTITAVVANGQVIVTLPEQSDAGDYEVNTAAYTAEASTTIGRGENGGRTLKEYNIVRQFRRLGVWHGEKRVMAVSLDSFPREATHVAVLLQRIGQGPIQGSAVAALH